VTAPTAASRTVAAVALLLAGSSGCSTHQPNPRYRPTQSVLEAVAVLRRHVPDDTYRFEPARDFTGRNVYRASLLRLENLEQIHAESLRAGHMDDVIAFAKGRSLERLRAYDLAATSYRSAAERDGPLRQDALASAAVCDALDEAAGLSGEQRAALLNALQEDQADSHYAAVIREELELGQLEDAQRLVAARRLEPDGGVRALSALQRLVIDHRESKNQNRHLLRLADLYEELAREYVAANPPAGLRFDPPAFEELVDAAARLYEAVANQDGATERLEASQRLESFIAFTLRVDRDRFSR
jgi:hypothetical protein